jgi:hypothetical protein
MVVVWLTVSSSLTISMLSSFSASYMLLQAMSRTGMVLPYIFLIPLHFMLNKDNVTSPSDPILTLLEENNRGPFLTSPEVGAFGQDR